MAIFLTYKFCILKCFQWWNFPILLFSHTANEWFSLYRQFSLIFHLIFSGTQKKMPTNKFYNFRCKFSSPSLSLSHTHSRKTPFYSIILEFICRFLLQTTLQSAWNARTSSTASFFFGLWFSGLDFVPYFLLALDDWERSNMHRLSAICVVFHEQIFLQVIEYTHTHARANSQHSCRKCNAYPFCSFHRDCMIFFQFKLRCGS